MRNVTVACVQPRFTVLESLDEFEAYIRRFLRLAQAKSASLTIFPELTGLMLVPSLSSRVQLGLAKRADRGRQRGAGPIARSVGRVADATASLFGGGLVGSLSRVLARDAEELLQLYLDTFSRLAREFSTSIVAGSLFVSDAESQTVRHRSYLFDAAGRVVGFQEKLHPSAREKELAVPGTHLNCFETELGRLGILLGDDLLVPELARALALHGADCIVGIAACPGAHRASLLRSALALRAEENQVYAAASFLLGPNPLERSARSEFLGQSALLAPTALSQRADGVLVQVGTARTEGVIAATLEADALQRAREAGDFQPRRGMNLANAGPALSAFLQSGLSIDEAVAGGLAAPPEAAGEPKGLGADESTGPLTLDEPGVSPDSPNEAEG